MTLNDQQAQPRSFRQYRKLWDKDFLKALYQINVEGNGANRMPDDDLGRSISDFYDRLADGSSSGRLWNWGFHDADLAGAVAPHIDQYSDSFSEQLYAKACVPEIGQSASGSIIADIGCGAGRGTALLSAMHTDLRFVGIDLSPLAIEAATQQRIDGRLDYICCSYADMPAHLPRIEHAVSIESMHNYVSVSSFLDALARSCKAGALVSIVDFFTRARRAELAECLAQRSMFSIVQDEDISNGVKDAIAQRVERIRDTARQAEHGILRRYFVSRGTEIMAGAQFLDRRDSLLGHLVSILSRGKTVKLDSYRHIVLRYNP